MRISTYVSRSVVFGIILGFSSPAIAQSGPSGNYEAQVTEADSLVWDLAGVSDLATDYSMGIENDDMELRVAFPRALQQTGTGKITGVGQGNTKLDIWNEDGHTSTSFPGTHKVNGVITSSRGSCKVRLATAVTGVVSLEGANRRLNASETMSATVNNAMLTVSGTATVKASASGLGSTSGKNLWSNDSADQTPHWTLRLLGITTAGTKVTGSAQVALHSGTVHSFTVKGNYNPKTQSSRLLVSGQGIAKGGNLIVTIGTANTITTIKGRIFGQSVDVAY